MDRSDKENILRQLSSPSKVTRLALLEQLLTENRRDKSIIAILLAIENVPPTITDYRERDRHLESLINQIALDKSSLSEESYIYIVSLLTGSLYENFEKFWGPTIHKLIDIIGESKCQKLLINFLINHFEITNALIYSPAEESEPVEASDRSDHVLHRNFIFQILAKFSQHVESQSTIFMDEFFKFVDKELKVSPFIEKVTRTCLISDKCDEPINQNGGETNRETEVVSSNAKASLKKSRRKSRKPIINKDVARKRKSRETFVTVAKVLQSFQNIEKVHRQAELKVIILDLLCCRDTSVQRAAFNCLLVYERQTLQPYIDQLLKILSDKSARTAITMLSSETEHNNKIRPEDRAFLMPVLLRIVFGKMISKFGKKSSGRNKADLRKNIVMRFIACCEPDEIGLYFQFIFDPLHIYLEVDYKELASSIDQSIDYSNFIPLNKLQAMVSTMTSYMESVANLKPEMLGTVYKLLSVVLYHVTRPLQDKDLVPKLSLKNLETLKNLRRSCMNAFTQFFQNFEYYNYHKCEIEFIFSNLIWNQTQGFVDKNHAAITPMLRFIQVLAGCQAYHKLLLLTDSVSGSRTLLELIIELYKDVKTTRSILKELAAILANILEPERTLTPESDQEMIVEEEFKNSFVLEDFNPVMLECDPKLYIIPKDIKLNHRMLLGYTPVILERLTSICTNFITKKDSENKIEKDELFVLSILCSYLRDSEQSLKGVRLLLSSLMHQRNKDLILNTMKAIQDLLRHISHGSDPTIVPILAEILGYQRDMIQRKELCVILDLLARINQQLAPVARSIILMNSTCEDLVEQPNIADWNYGFQEAFSYIDNLNTCVDEEMVSVKEPLILLLHQVNFIIGTIDRYEFSIRDNCSTFHEKLSVLMAKVDPKNVKLTSFIIDELVLDKFIKKGLRETNDMIRHSYLRILRSWANHCHKHSRVLQEFHLFCSDQDDLDFWLNIRHIQLHNRSRALARLIGDARLQHVSSKTLSAYFLPIAAGFLFNKNYKSVSSLAENSIKLIGIICRQLNWITYESTLSFYLDQLIRAKTVYQKMSIKLITEILKNFNFDLSACEEAHKDQEENSKLEKRMQKRISIDKNIVQSDAPSGKRLNPSTARMVYNSVMKKLIPRLSSCLHEMTRSEFEHDKNMANYLPEKEEVKRIPMAYAIVQLLCLLPCRYILLRDNLPAIFLKMTSFLRSKNEQIRKVARAILIKVMNFIGPAYISDLIRILRQNLDKGFYIHVLNYTIHSVLEKVSLFHGSIDHSVNELLQLSFQEIFGQASEDKEVAQVLAKTFEAKKTKSYDTLLIVATYISPAKLTSLMDCIKKELVTASDPKKVSKLSNCIQKVFTGLSRNEDFPVADMLDFIYESIEESIPSLKVPAKVNQAESSGKLSSSLREDRFLIMKDLPRSRVKSKINEKGNLHMVVENSLRLLLHTLERNKSSIKKTSSYDAVLDKFVKLLTKCLNSSSPRCIMRALKCVSFIAQSKASLPQFVSSSNIIIKKIFILLSIYNGVGMVQGENSEMIAMCFKALTLLLVECKQAKLEGSQLQALMTYIEQDLCDANRQASAFSILNSLLEKKYCCQELDEVMKKVGELLITSEDDTVRKSSVKLWQVYLLDYSHNSKILQAHLTKFLRQLDYELIDGRKSILAMLEVVLTRFPLSILSNYYELTFHLLSQRLVNEESSEVRGQVGRLIGVIIHRLRDKQLFLFNKFVMPWASDQNTQIKLLGVKLLTVFIETQDGILRNDKSRRQKVLDVILQSLEADQPDSKTTDLAVFEDKLNYHALRLFRRLLMKQIIQPLEIALNESLRKIWLNIATKRLSDLYIRTVLTSCQLYIVFISHLKTCESLSDNDYMVKNGKIIMRTLIDKFIDLLDLPTAHKLDPNDQKMLLSYINQALISLGCIVASSDATKEFETEYLAKLSENLFAESQFSSSGFIDEHLPYKITEAKKRVDLFWMATKIVMQARKEAALYRLKSYYRRELALRWIAAVAQELGSTRINTYATLFIMPPVRELSDKAKGNSEDAVLTLSMDLLKFIKQLLGEEPFNKVYSKVQLYYTRRRVDRKQKEALLKVREQARGVKRKMKKSRENEARRKRAGRSVH